MLTIVGATFISGSSNDTSIGGDSFEYDHGRGAADSFGVANFSTAGLLLDHLLMFQRHRALGRRSLRSRRRPTHRWAAPALFHLVGDTAERRLGDGRHLCPGPLHRRRQPADDERHQPQPDGHGQQPHGQSDRPSQWRLLCRDRTTTAPGRCRPATSSPRLADGTYNVLVRCVEFGRANGVQHDRRSTDRQHRRAVGANRAGLPRRSPRHSTRSPFNSANPQRLQFAEFAIDIRRPQRAARRSHPHDDRQSELDARQHRRR